MTVVSSKEFLSNGKKYFDLALNEQVFVKRGDYMFHIICSNYDTATKREQKILQPDDDLRRAITGKEFRKSAMEIVEKVHYKFYGNERKIHPTNA